MTGFKNDKCPNCGKWLASHEEICSYCHAPRNLFDEEDAACADDNGVIPTSKIKNQRIKSIFVIGLWILLLPALFSMIPAIDFFINQPLHVQVMASLIPSIYLFLLFHSLKHFIKDHFPQKKGHKSK